MPLRLLPRLKISAKVLVYFLLVSLVPLLLVSIVLADRGRALLRDAAITNQRVVAESTADKINIYLDDRIRALVLQSKLLSTAALEPGVVSKNFEALMKQDESIEEVILLDKLGMQIVKVDTNGMDDSPLDKSLTDSFKAVSFLKGKHFVGSVNYSEGNVPTITIATPILPSNFRPGTDDVNQFLGVIIVKYDIAGLWQAVLSTKIGQGGYAYVVDSLGNLVAHPESEFLSKNQKVANVAAVRNFINDNYDTAVTTSEQGVEVISTPIKLANSNWAVIVQEPVISIYSGMNSFIQLSVIIIVSSGLFAIVLSLIFRKQLLDPIKQLILGTDKISRGNYDYIVKVKTSDEMRDLANTFNDMAQNINKLIGDLKIKNVDLDRATKQLSHANEKLKQADTTKDEFISMASHQLGTPLTTIEGYLSMVHQGYYGELNEKLATTVNKALGRTQVMRSLLLDFLDVSRMTANKFYLDIEPTDFNKIIGEEVSALSASAAEAGVQLAYHPPHQPPALINIDEQKTRQAVMNLITNAINYTAGGKVDVFLRYNDADVQYTVVDNGIGVPDKEKPKLFSKFYRAGNAKESRPSGTGLGLYLVRRVVEDQGGRVVFKSEQGKGSTFGFILPLDTKLPLGQYFPPSNSTDDSV
ncbi:sensor histidine kinase [Candidatus Saccharibacteria bacterium]|nr:sensor histidine kinase [Candidatus Saccharibacteria bacterium]